MGFNDTTAVINAPSRRLFRPMFRARWQNMQNIITDTVYISCIPEPYKTYYQAFTQQWIEWSRGFVPMLHRQDFFSVGMGYTVCDIYSRECMNGGYRIQSADDLLKHNIETWTKNEVGDTFNEMFFYTTAGGNAILVLTPVDGELALSVLPVNRVVFQVGRRNVITNAMLLNRFSAGSDVYFSREYRVMMEGKPYYKVELGKGTLATSPEWSSTGIAKIPDDIKEQWKLAYGNISPDKWYEMPKALRSLGLYNVKNKSVAVALADLPGYSDSSLHTALDLLYSIDYNHTQGEVDQYMGKGRALVPRQMNKSLGTRSTIADGQSFNDAVNCDAETPLDGQFYDQVRSQTIDGQEIKPTFMQPELRGVERKQIRDDRLELLASKVGLSSSTLANHLAYNHNKTATEFEGEQDTTEKSVNDKRKLASPPIDAMLADVARFYGWLGIATIQWGRARLNTPAENTALLEEYQAGTLTLRQYLRKRWVNLTEGEIEDMAREIDESEEKKRKAETESFFDETDYFGGLDENSEQTAKYSGDSTGGSGDKDKDINKK